ncbi:DNA polymerase III subunit beta [Nonomuraea sp. NPDC049158]|uniref:DNA polymerase III subunit beta n=1 Tax=Nonomuraea sp. NPDC049158 TaxID=3155649 RepID=UPI0033CE1032
MKFTIMAGELADAVGWVCHALPKRPVTPVLNGILLQTGELSEGEGLQVSAFDYDTSRKADVELEAPIEAGRALLPGRILAEVAKTLPKGEPVDVAVDDKQAVIRCGRSEFTLPLMPVDDFPALPEPPATVGSLASKMLADAIAQVAVAAGTDPTIPNLTGVRLEVGDGLIDLAATNRYRMTWRTMAWSPVLDAPAELKVLIPAQTLADIARSLPQHAHVQVGLSKQLAAFVSAGRCATVRLLDPEFCNFRSLMQAEASIVAEFDASALAAVVKRVAVLAEPSTPVRLSFTQHTMLVEAGNADSGRGSETADCTLDGADIQIAFNPPFLLDALNVFGGGAVQLRMADPVKPALLGRDGDDDYRHLIMPIRLTP